MTTSVRNLAKPAVGKRPRSAVNAHTAPKRKPAKRVAAKNAIIPADLAPAIAIALLEKTEQAPSEPPPAGSMPFRVERNDLISSWPERTDGRADA